MLSKKPVIIGIAGGSGTGKSTHVAIGIQKFLHNLGKVTIVSQDDFRKSKNYKLQINSKYKWDDPRIFSINECNSFLNNTDSPILNIPKYDNKNFKRLGFTKIKNTKFIIFEGIYALNKKLCSYYSLKIYVESPLYSRIIKRVVRGKFKYKYTNPDNLILQALTSVLAAHSDFVVKQKLTADIVVTESLKFDYLISEYKLKKIKKFKGEQIFNIKLQKYLHLLIIKNRKYYIGLKYKNNIYLKIKISENTKNIIQQIDLFSL